MGGGGYLDFFMFSILNNSKFGIYFLNSILFSFMFINILIEYMYFLESIAMIKSQHYNLTKLSKYFCYFKLDPIPADQKLYIP